MSEKLSKEQATRLAERAALALFRSKDTAETLSFIINDLVLVGGAEMSVEDIQKQLQLIAPAVKTMIGDCTRCLEDVNFLKDYVEEDS